MNTVTKVAFSVVLGVIAIGAQSFKSNVKSNVLDKTYYQKSNGTYTSIEPSGDCLSQNNDPCVVTYLGTTPSQENWDFAHRPVGTIQTEDLGFRQ